MENEVDSECNVESAMRCCWIVRCFVEVIVGLMTGFKEEKYGRKATLI